MRLHSPVPLLPPTLVLSTRADAPLVLFDPRTRGAGAFPTRACAGARRARAGPEGLVPRGSSSGVAFGGRGAHRVPRGTDRQRRCVATAPVVGRTHQCAAAAVTLTDHGTLADAGRRVATWLLLLALACLLAMAWPPSRWPGCATVAPLLLQAADLAQLPPWPQARGEKSMPWRACCARWHSSASSCAPNLSARPCSCTLCSSMPPWALPSPGLACLSK